MAEVTSLKNDVQDVLTVNHLAISFGGLKAVDDLSFSVREKEIFGLIGPNGAGKTTAFNCITQFYKPDQGEVLFKTDRQRLQKNYHGSEKETVNLVGLPVHDIIGLGLVRTFQNVEIVKEISVIDNVLLGGHIEYKSTGIEQVLRLPRARREEKLMRQKALEILCFLGIQERKDQICGSQPFGIQKKIELARTLMCQPGLIILDEPAAGLNDAETEELTALIYDIRDKYQCAILLIEHDMGLVMGICDRICAISFGKFLACGIPQEIQNNKLVKEAYLGEEG